MSASTTSIAELPDTNIQTQPVNTQQSVSFPSELPQQGPVSTQQISNEFYGNVSAQPQYPQNTHVGDEANLQYQPINLHPNPYGQSQSTPEGPPLPSASPQRNQNNNYNVENIPRQTLPSRDIPMNTLEYQHDETIKPNHVPSVKLTSDYIRDFERENDEQLRLHRENKYRQETAHNAIGDLQLPILVAILYFIFSTPIITKLMYKYLGFLKSYDEDGSFKISALILRSAIFGGIIYSIQKLADTVSSI